MLQPISTLAQQGIHAHEWAGRGSLHSVTVAFLLGALLVSIFARKKFFLFLILIASVGMLSPAQRVIFASLDFSVPRIVILMLLVRITLRASERLKRWTKIDSIFAILMLLHLIGNTLRSDGSVVNRLGFSLDYFGSYLVLRSLIRDVSDIRSVCLAVSAVAVLMLPFYLIEQITRRNLLSFMGGIPDYVVMRNGRPRCQGAFSHPINSGLFFGLMLPVITGILVASRLRDFRLLIGFIAALLILLTSASSTPASVLVTGTLVWLMFRTRWMIPFMAWLCIPVLFWGHFYLNNGLPSLFAKLDLVAGSTGWHRYHLIDTSFKNIGEWWAIGITGGTAHWGGYLGDVTNEYLLHGFSAGILGFVLMIALVVVTCIKTFGATVDLRNSNTHRTVAYGIFASLIAVSAALTSVTLFSGLFVTFSFLVASGVAMADTSNGALGAESKGLRPSGERRAVGDSLQPTLTGRANGASRLAWTSTQKARTE